MTDAPREIIFASAGTGKTYALSGHYLRLVLAGVPADRIVAVTFTRKAAGEILGRVLERLASAVTRDADRRSLALAVGARELSPAACRRALAELTRSLDRLAIGTIDSFFARLGTAFALELDLPLRVSVASPEQDAMTREAALLAAFVGMPAQELSTLVHLIHGESWRPEVVEPMLRRIDSLYHAFLDAPLEAWHATQPRSSPLDDASIGPCLDALRRAPVPLTKEHKPNARWAKAHASSVDLATQRRWEEFVGHPLSARVIDGQTPYHGVPFPPELARAYEPLIRHASALLLARNASTNRALVAFLTRFHAEYAAAKARLGQRTFDDIPRALAAADATGDLPHLYYRVDARFDHLLLDEFQDTSVAQFRLLEPLIDEVLTNAEGARSFLCVGDAKQSLYRWRDAEPELLGSLGRRWTNLATRELHENRRSSRAVLRAVNQVFGTLAGNTACADDEDIRAAAAQFESEYPAHTGIVDAEGCVRLSTGGATTGAQPQRLVTVWSAADRVAELARRFPRATIGVLMPVKARMRAMIRALADRGVTASQEGGNAIADSQCVALLLSALRLAAHPGDSASRFHLAHSALGPPMDVTPDLPEDGVRALASGLREELASDGYARTLRRWFDLIAPRCPPSEQASVESLLALADEADRQPAIAAGDFESLARRRRAESPSPDRVRVMTIHGSKGLEFDFVVLTDLSAPLVGSKGLDLLTLRRGALEPISAVSVAPPSLTPLHPLLREMRRVERTRRASERFCVLYVAMTRARFGLDIVIDPRGVSKADGITMPGSLAGVVHAALAPTTTADPNTVLWSDGDESTPLPHSDATEAPPPAPSLAQPPTPRVVPAGTERTLPRVIPSAMTGPHAPVDAAEILRDDDGTAALRGRCFHAWFESTEWSEGPIPDDHHLASIAGWVGATDVTRTKAWIASFRRSLGAPGVRSVMSRQEVASRLGVGASEVVVLREQGFACRARRAGRDVLLEGRFDRLAVAISGGRALRAEVVDFKTLRAGDDPRRVREKYLGQLEAYRQGAAAILSLDPGAVRVRLVAVDDGVAIDV